MKLSEVFDSQARRTKELEAQLSALNGEKWPTITKQFDADDKPCILKAAEYNAAVTAGSLTALALGIELKQLRARRDAPRAAFFRERLKILNELESLTLPTISVFHEFALDFAKSLSKKLTLEKSEPYYSVQQDTRYVTIKTNEGAIDQAINIVIARIKEVREMSHHTLADIKKRITECRREFLDFDLSVVEDERIVPASSAPRPIRPKQSLAEGF